MGKGMDGSSNTPRPPDRDTDYMGLLHSTGWRLAWAVLREVTRRCWTDDAFGLAGNVAFRTVLGLFPFLIFTSSVTVFVGSAYMADGLTDFLIAIVPSELANPIVSEIKEVTSARHSGILGMGLLVTVWFSISGIDGVRVSLNRSYGLCETRSTLVLYMLQGAMVILTSMVFALVGYMLIVTPRTGPWLTAFLPDPDTGSMAIVLIRYSVAILILVAGLFVAHWVLPARRVLVADIWPGIAFTTIMWILLGAVFSVYLRRFGTYASYYAELGGIIAALYFVYLAALILILGGEFNRALRIRRLGSPPGDVEVRAA
jgi:membrane protein